MLYTFQLAETFFFKKMTEIQLKENRTQKEFAFDERILMTQLESPQNLIQTEFPIKLNMIESRKLSFLMPVQ